MSDVLINVEGVSKKFCRSLKKSLWYGMQDIGSEILGRRHGGSGALRSDEFWAVNEVSFQLKRGECLGLIGPNGAGKSTLLKMLNGLIKPDAGRIEIRGRVGALLELGAGFNPLLTGRENIYVNGSVLGLSKKEIDLKFDEIIAFAELKEFIDAPVQSYSSGMKVRLGFAIAAQMEPDVLLIDEVLAVGDVGFRAKCYNSIAKIGRNAVIIFVSHAMQSVGRICSRVIVIEAGAKIYDGNTHNGIHCYDSLFKSEKFSIAGSGRAKIHDFEFKTSNGNQARSLAYGEPFQVEMVFSVSQEISNPILYIGFHDQAMNCVAEINSRNDGIIIKNVGENIRVAIKIDQLLLSPGRYRVSSCVYDDRMQEHLVWYYGNWTLQVTGGFYGLNAVQFKGEWEVESKSIAQNVSIS